MEQSTFRVAFTGAYDIANYGDHLFPPIFQREMENRGVSCELVLFSLFETQEPFQNGVSVYPLSRLEEMHLQNPFDAIVVGGGELIHYSSCQQLFSPDDTDYQTYNIYATWIIPSLIGLKYGVKVLWNAPGGQYSFPQFYRFYTKHLTSCVDYLSVRNRSTKEFLLECGIPDDQISVVPDTGLWVASLYSEEELNECRAKLLDFDTPYAVLHMNRYIEDEDFEALVNAAKFLYDKGLQILCFPLAYTHNDASMVQRIQRAFPQIRTAGITDNSILSLRDMVSLLSGCTLYLGISFHGAVTTLAFGKKAVNFDYTGSVKTKDLYESLGLEQFYVRKREEINKALERALNYSYPDCTGAVEGEIKKHFDRIAREICSTPDCAPMPGRIPVSGEAYFDFINSLTQYYLNADYDISIMKKRLEDKDAVMARLYQEAEEAQQYISTITTKQAEDMEEARRYIGKLENDISAMKKWVSEKDEVIAQLQKQAEEARQYIGELENNRKGIRKTKRRL